MDNLSEDKIETMVEKLASMGHSSPFCQVSYTFGIENVSRAFTHQFARHHVGVSFDQRSQRYVNEGKFNYITPPAIEANDEIHEKFQAFMEYTSQECSCCHHISKKNRQTQEHFHCENCGFELNADLNASINIKNRILSNVLRKSCHQEIKPNKFIPIGIKHEEFKQIYTQMLNDIY